MRLFISIAILLLPMLKGYGQASFPHVFDETELQFKVVQIDEFMRRFNYDAAYDGSKPLEKNDTLYEKERLKNMSTLFNLAKFGSKQTILDSLSMELFRYVIDNNIRLDYKDSSWYAKVDINAIYNQKKQTVTLYLHPEQIKDNEYKWVIFDVKSSLFKMESGKDSLLILPSEHGIGFVSLPEKIKLRPRAVNTLFYKGYKYDPLIVFHFLISNQIMKVSTVREVVFHYDLPAYSFDVERIERDKTYNKGWLINSIVRK